MCHLYKNQEDVITYDDGIQYHISGFCATGLMLGYEYRYLAGES